MAAAGWAAPFEVEIDYLDVRQVYELEPGTSISDVWQQVPPVSGRPKRVRRWPTVRIELVASEVDRETGDVRLGCHISREERGHPSIETQAFLVFLGDSPSAEATMGLGVPAPMSQAKVRYRKLYRPLLDIRVRPVDPGPPGIRALLDD